MKKIKVILCILACAGVFFGLASIIQSTTGPWPWWGWFVYLITLILVIIVGFFIALGRILKDHGSFMDSSCSFPEDMYS